MSSDLVGCYVIVLGVAGDCEVSEFMGPSTWAVPVFFGGHVLLPLGRSELRLALLLGRQWLRRLILVWFVWSFLKITM